jgi:hypothetical protein
MGIFISILLMVVLLTVVFIAVFKYKNRRLTPDDFEYYKTPDAVPTGKVGIFVPSLIMPEKHDHTYFYTITMKFLA